MRRAVHIIIPIIPTLFGATPGMAQGSAPVRADTTVLFEAFSPGTTPGAAHLAAAPENAQVMRDSAGTWLQTTEGTTFAISFPRALPDSFQVEATLWADQATPINMEVGSQLTWRCGMEGISVESQGVTSEQGFPNSEHHSPVPVHCRLVVNGRGMEGWITENRLLSLPNVPFERPRSIEIRVPGGEQPSRFQGLRIFTVHAAAAAANRPATRL